MHFFRCFEYLMKKKMRQPKDNNKSNKQTSKQTKPQTNKKRKEKQDKKRDGRQQMTVKVLWFGVRKRNDHMKCMGLFGTGNRRRGRH